MLVQYQNSCSQIWQVNPQGPRQSLQQCRPRVLVGRGGRPRPRKARLQRDGGHRRGPGGRPRSRRHRLPNAEEAGRRTHPGRGHGPPRAGRGRLRSRAVAVPGEQGQGKMEADTDDRALRRRRRGELPARPVQGRVAEFGEETVGHPGKPDDAAALRAGDRQRAVSLRDQSGSP